MSLISCQSISKSFGARNLFESISITIGEGERIGLIGPNGAGKSTLIQILAGVQQPDSGLVSFRKNLRLGYVPQESKFPEGETARTVVESVIAERDLDEAERESLVNVTLGRANFTDLEVAAHTLSGGWKKRLAVARELARDPDVLLLDEPTNHLDLEGILWLERLLKTLPFASIVVSHDRYFLENVASDMAEINRIYPEGIFRAPGRYSEFLLEREKFLHAQAKQMESLENKVRREVEWLQRGPKARTTKSKARIDSAGRLMGELADMQSRSTSSSAGIDFAASGRKTKRLLNAVEIGKQLGGRVLFDSLDLTLGPGMRLGLVGPNGSGKTTLLRILAGELAPDCGTIERADNLRVVYFEQNRDHLDPEVSLRRALCPHGDSVIYRDRPIHVAGWAKRFLFHSEQLDMPVSRLSGGERARLLIARLMLQPADLLLLDEPTNDLDIPTLEVLEESLMDFPGALVLVTHDRYMLDRVSTIVLGLNGKGGSGLFADYSQWEQARSEGARVEKREEAPRPAPANGSGKKRLSYMEQREWDSMEDRIQAAERELARFQIQIEEASAAADAVRLRQAYDNAQASKAEVDKLYARWAELETKLP